MSIFTPRLLAFAGGEANIGVYKMFADYWNHGLAVNSNNPKHKNLEYIKLVPDSTGKMVEISFSEKESRMNAALKKEILRVAGITNIADFPLETWAGHPTLSWAMFAVVNQMIDMILPEVINDSVGLYSEVRNVGFGDSAAWDVSPRDLFVVSKVGQAKRISEMHKQYKGQVVMIPEPRQLTVAVSLYRVLAGKESLAEFVAKVVRSMESEFSLDIYNAFATAMAALDNTASTGLRVAGYTQDEFVRLSQTVTAWNQGAKAVAIGTQRALAKILPADANYRYDIESEFVRIGYLRNFQGTDIMMLPQIADWETPFGLKLSDSTIWLISPSSDKIVKATIEGTTLARTDAPDHNANLIQTSTLYKSWKAGVVTNAVGATITL